MDNAQRRTQEVPYHYDDPAIMGDQLEYQELLYDFNQLRPTDTAAKQTQLKRMFAEIGEGCHVEVPAHANWGFHHVHMGQGVYCNVNFTCVDDAEITIGDNSVIGAGAVVDRDIPANVVAVGVPCKVLRPIGNKDREYYFRDRRLDVAE